MKGEAIFETKGSHCVTTAKAHIKYYVCAATYFQSVKSTGVWKCIRDKGKFSHIVPAAPLLSSPEPLIIPTALKSLEITAI